MGIKSLLKSLQPYASLLMQLALVFLPCALALLCLPWLAGRLLGDILVNGGGPVWTMALTLAAAVIAAAVFHALGGALAARISTRVEADTKGDLLAHVQRLPISFVLKRRRGDLTALLTLEVAQLGAFLDRLLRTAPIMLLVAAGAAFALFAISPPLCLFALLLIAACHLVNRMITRELKGLSTKIQKAEARLFAQATQALEMLPFTKALAQEESELPAYRQLVDKVRRHKHRRQRVQAMHGPAVMAAAAVGTLLLAMVMASRLVPITRAGIQDLLIFAFNTGLLAYAMHRIAHLFAQFEIARGTFDRLENVLQRSSETADASETTAPRLRGWITLSKLWFAYPDRDYTLRGVDLDIEAGETIALAGESGSGKSTILALLLGLYTPQRGSIRIDGRELSELNLAQIRGQIGYVPQIPILQSGSIIDNLRMGNEGISPATMQQACKLAQAHDFITKLPNGYRSEIGERGLGLSIGERQRIALARALLREPTILLMDEPTALLDPEDEVQFLEACRAVGLGCTTIMVTQRPACLAMADRIVTLENGRIIEGNPRENPARQAAPTGPVIIEQQATARRAGGKRRSE